MHDDVAVGLDDFAAMLLDHRIQRRALGDLVVRQDRIELLGIEVVIDDLMPGRFSSSMAVAAIAWQKLPGGREQHRRRPPDGLHRQIWRLARRPSQSQGDRRRRQGSGNRPHRPRPGALRLQDHERGAVRRAVVLPRLFRLGQVRQRTLQHRPAHHREDRPDLPPQRQDPHQRARPRRRRHRRRGETEGHPHRQHSLRRQKTVSLPKVPYPKPNIHASLKSSVKGEEDKIASGLAALHHEDPTFLYTVDSELRQTILSAQGELHLEVIADNLRSRYNVHVELIEPRVRYRETIKGRGDSKYRHKKQTGGAGQFAEVWMRIEPKPRDTGVEFTNSLVGQNVDRVFVPSVEKGVMKASEEGILAGYRVVDVKIDFYDGKMHPVDSKDIAFQIAGYFGFKEAFNMARPCLLEPIHLVEIRIPEDCMGKVMGDLSSRRGKIQGMDMEGGFQLIKAHVPAKELYRYSSTLRSLTGGRGVHSESFSHYEEMPREAEQRVIEESKKAKQQQAAE